MDIDATKINCTVVPPSVLIVGTDTSNVIGQYCHGKSIIKFEEGETTLKSVNLKD